MVNYVKLFILGIHLIYYNIFGQRRTDQIVQLIIAALFKKMNK